MGRGGSLGGDLGRAGTAEVACDEQVEPGARGEQPEHQHHDGHRRPTSAWNLPEMAHCSPGPAWIGEVADPPTGRPGLGQGRGSRPPVAVSHTETWAGWNASWTTPTRSPRTAS